MAYASQAGRAHASMSNPRAFAVCDRCGFWYNHYKLQWQFDWAGQSLVNKRILVCATCLDKPQQQLRAIVLPADPVPIIQPRPEMFFMSETDVRFTGYQQAIDPVSGITISPIGDYRVTQDGKSRVVQQTGEAPGGLNETPGVPPAGLPAGQDPGLPPGNDEVPETGPLE